MQAKGTADDVVVLGQGEPLPPLAHLFEELIVGHRHAHSQIDEHVRHGSVPGSRPIPRVGYVRVVGRVVHIADDVQNRTLRKEWLVAVFVRVATNPVVVISDATQRLDVVAPNCFQAHPLAGCVKMRFEGDELRVLLQHFVGVEFLTVLHRLNVDVHPVP